MSKSIDRSQVFYSRLRMRHTGAQIQQIFDLSDEEASRFNLGHTKSILQSFKEQYQAELKDHEQKFGRIKK